MKNRTPEESRNRINRLSEALFGTPDEIGEEEADQLLSEADGVALLPSDGSSLCDRVVGHGRELLVETLR